MPSKTGTCLADRSDDRPEGEKFDYNRLPSSVAKFLQGQADRIRRHCASSIIQIGKALTEAKRHLSHGQFLLWVEGEVGMPVRTAQAYTRIASWAATKGATVAYLTPSALHLLSASSTPEEFAADVLSRVKEGEHISASVLRKELAAWRGNDRQAHLEVERSPPLVLSADSKQVSDATGRNSTARATAEIVAILARGLSGTDFARVRDITNGDVVQSDPQFAKNLADALLSYQASIEPMFTSVSPDDRVCAGWVETEIELMAAE
jgi:hypothetical protein